jgi:hypothetical protein
LPAILCNLRAQVGKLRTGNYVAFQRKPNWASDRWLLHRTVVFVRYGIEAHDLATRNVRRRSATCLGVILKDDAGVDDGVMVTQRGRFRKIMGDERRCHVQLTQVTGTPARVASALAIERAANGMSRNNTSGSSTSARAKLDVIQAPKLEPRMTRHQLSDWALEFWFQQAEGRTNHGLDCGRACGFSQEIYPGTLACSQQAVRITTLRPWSTSNSPL